MTHWHKEVSSYLRCVYEGVHWIYEYIAMYKNVKGFILDFCWCWFVINNAEVWKRIVFAEGQGKELEEVRGGAQVGKSGV